MAYHLTGSAAHHAAMEGRLKPLKPDQGLRYKAKKTLHIETAKERITIPKGASYRITGTRNGDGYVLTIEGAQEATYYVMASRSEGLLSWAAGAILVALAGFLAAPGDAQAAPCMAPTPACASQLPPPPKPQPKPQPKPHQGDIHFDVQRARDRDTFLQLYAQTAACMREGSVAMLRYGSRDSDDIKLWLVKTCGNPLYSWLTDKEHFSDRKAATFLLGLAGKGLDAALRGPDEIIVR